MSVYCSWAPCNERLSTTIGTMEQTCPLSRNKRSDHLTTRETAYYILFSAQKRIYTAVSRKVVRKNVHATIPKGNMGYDQFAVPDTAAVESSIVAFLSQSQTFVHGVSCHSFKFLWRTKNSKPPTIPFGIVARTFSDNLSRNSCKQNTYTKWIWKVFISV